MIKLAFLCALSIGLRLGFVSESRENIIRGVGILQQLLYLMITDQTCKGPFINYVVKTGGGGFAK